MNLPHHLGAVLSLALLCAPAFAKDHWVASWGAGSVKIAGEAVPAAGVTYRNVSYMSLGGHQVRLTISNRFNAQPLTIGGASVARSAGEGNLDAASLATVRFGGKPGTVVAPGATIVSDPVSIDVPALSSLVVSIFLPAQTITAYTGHPVSHQTNYRADGNQIAAAAMPGVTAIKPWHMLTAIDVAAPANAAAIVAFGDSITDGQGSTDNANHRWPNELAVRLQADPKYRHLAVVDEGIGGNRILHPGGEPEARAGMHESGVVRWPYDALDRSGVKYIVLLEGINDIGRSSMIREKGAGANRPGEDPVSADDLIHAMTDLIDQAHRKGIKVIGATLTPYGGANYERPDGQEAHQKLNDFIRKSGKFDGVIDFEKAVQDPAQPTAYRTGFNNGDHLHPNDAATKAMADSIDLSLFR